MNPKPSTTQLPVVTGIAGLSLAEQAALAFIHEHPGCSNRALANRIGTSVRGVETMLARFRKLGLIRRTGVGRGRTLELTFTVDDHTECGRAPTGGLARVQESHTKCGHAPKRLPGDGHFVSQTPAVGKAEKVTRRTAADVADDIAGLFDSFEKAKNDHSAGGMRVRTLAFWSWQLTELLVEAKRVFPPVQEFTDLLAKVERQRNHWAVCSFVGEFAEGEREFIRVARRLRAATDQQLAVLYARIQREHQLGPPSKTPLQLEAVLADRSAEKA